MKHDGTSKLSKCKLIKKKSNPKYWNLSYASPFQNESGKIELFHFKKGIKYSSCVNHTSLLSSHKNQDDN